MKSVLRILLVMTCFASVAMYANITPVRMPLIASGSNAEIELAEALKEIKELRKELRDESKAAADARREAEHYYNLVIKRLGS